MVVKACWCSGRIKSRTQDYHFTCKRGYFGQNKVADWHTSLFCRKFCTKNIVADSTLMRSKKSGSSISQKAWTFPLSRGKAEEPKTKAAPGMLLGMRKRCL